VLAADGKKLSKRLKNYPDPSEIFEKYGADPLRFFMMSSPVVGGEDVRFSSDSIQEVSRNVFMRLWNVHSFFTTYAEVDNWQPLKELTHPNSENVLDQWLLARLNQTIEESTRQADQYKIARAVRPLRELIDDLSNWYVRRSRRRFWKSEDDGDKAAAYATLHYVLMRIAQLLAPWSPFVADKLWRELTVGMDVSASVHESDWPKAGEIDGEMLSLMADAREAINVGLSLRAQAAIKVRQPLASATVNASLRPLESIVVEELNVKAVSYVDEPTVGMDLELTPELRREGMMRDIVRHVQSLRKQSGLNVEDRIELAFTNVNPELTQAIEEYQDVIKTETLAKNLNFSKEFINKAIVKVDGSELTISLQKTAV